MSACLICGSTESRVLFQATDRLYRTTRKKFSVVRCANCGLVRLDPVPTPEELPGYYPDNYWFVPDASSASRMEEAYRRLVLSDHVRFVAEALRHTKARGPVLDVGCGGGLFLGLMRRHRPFVVGLDNSHEAASIAWRRQQVPAVCAMLEHVPFRAGSVAVLTMFHVLEHLYDPRAYLITARNLLAPDGRLVIQVPNAACWQFRMLGEAWNGVDVPRHIFDFRASDVEKLLESCGFEVARRKYFSLRDNPAGLASSLAPSLDPMARRVRGNIEAGPVRIGKDLLYLALVAASLPFTLLEAACGAGSTVMIEARRK